MARLHWSTVLRATSPSCVVRNSRPLPRFWVFLTSRCAITPTVGLDQVRRSRLVGEVIDAAAAARAAGLLVFDPSGVTGHHDHAAASAAALLAAARLNLPVLGWTLPDSVATQLNRECGTGFVGHPAVAIDIEFLGFHWNLPVGVGYLLSAVAGATATVLVGAARINQLGRAAKKSLGPL
jgi:hypothetical protein